MTALATPQPLPIAPAPPGKFPFGHLDDYRRNGMQTFLRAAKEYGDVVRLRFGFDNMYLVNHPDGVQHVLQTGNRNYGRQSFGNRMIEIVTGLNLFTSEGDYWLRQRRLMQPAFHRKEVAGFAGVMTRSALEMIERWQPDIRQGLPLDMHREMIRITMEVVGKTLFSVDLSDETSVLGRAFTASTDYINYRFSAPFAPPLWVPTRWNRLARRAIQDAQRILQEMIDERRRTGRREGDLMDMLMDVRYEDTGEGMTDEQLRSELVVIIGAGQETTSNLLTWAFYQLSKYPEVSDRLLDELETVLGGRVPEIEDLPRLPYTRMVLEETIRVYPPAWALTTRDAKEDDEILGYRIPKGHLVFILPYILHHDPRFWDAPERFEPERFTPERVAERHKYAYIPFGAGPRKCIGNTFALIEAQLILATVYPRVQLDVQPGYQVEMDPAFTLRVKGGLPMLARMRA